MSNIPPSSSLSAENTETNKKRVWIKTPGISLPTHPPPALGMCSPSPSCGRGCEQPKLLSNTHPVPYTLSLLTYPRTPFSLFSYITNSSLSSRKFPSALQLYCNFSHLKKNKSLLTSCPLPSNCPQALLSFRVRFFQKVIYAHFWFTETLFLVVNFGNNLNIEDWGSQGW